MNDQEVKVEYVKRVERDVIPIANEAWEAFDDAYSDDERRRVLWTYLNHAYARGAVAGRADAIAQAIEQTPPEWELHLAAIMLCP